MKSYIPDKNSLNILRGAAAILTTILIVALRFIIKPYVLVTVLSVILAFMAIILMFIYLPLYFSSLSYYLHEKEIVRISGVLFRKKQTIQITSVQYYTLISTPFSKSTGLNFIIFHVYGGRLTLMFLGRDDIREIIAFTGIEQLRR